MFRTFENAQSEKVDAGGRQLGFVLALLMNFAPARGAVAAYVQALIIMCSLRTRPLKVLPAVDWRNPGAQRTSCRRQQATASGLRQSTSATPWGCRRRSAAES